MTRLALIAMMTFVSFTETSRSLTLDVRMTALAHFLTLRQQVLQIHSRLRRRRFLLRIRQTSPLISVIFSPVTLMVQRTANSPPLPEAGRLPAIQKRRGTLKEMILGTLTGIDPKMVCKRYHWTKLVTALKKRNKHGTLEEGTGAAVTPC